MYNRCVIEFISGEFDDWVKSIFNYDEALQNLVFFLFLDLPVIIFQLSTLVFGFIRNREILHERSSLVLTKSTTSINDALSDFDREHFFSPNMDQSFYSQLDLDNKIDNMDDHVRKSNARIDKMKKLQGTHQSASFTITSSHYDANV